MKAEYSAAVMAAQGLYQLVDYAIIGGLAVENVLTTSFIIIQISFCLGFDSQHPPELQFSADANYVTDHGITNQLQDVSEFGSEVVNWCSKRKNNSFIVKQKMKAEYREAVMAAQEVWLNQLLKGEASWLIIQFQDTAELGSNLFGNESSISCEMHMEVHYHFLRERISCGKLEQQHISMEDSVTDYSLTDLMDNNFAEFQLQLGLPTRELSSRENIGSQHCL